MATTRLAIPLNTVLTGRVATVKIKSGYASVRAVRSAKVMARVELLLAAHRQSAGLLDVTAQSTRKVNALAGRAVGAWVLESELGRGGMSVVYSARP